MNYTKTDCRWRDMKRRLTGIKGRLNSGKRGQWDFEK